ncbi:MAG TPA: TetR/AcrR family transcriptional regulator [Nocardioides sp.]|nr:TetR/AcrR family transcriptional regulator [Nocardioides sp.]
MNAQATRVRRRSGPTKGDQREHAILEATRTLLADRTVNDLTIDAIAKAAGVSRTAFYFYFPTKHAVVAALLDGLWEQFGSTHGWFDSEGADRAGLLEHHHLVAQVWREHLPILTCTAGAVEYEPLVAWVEQARTRLVTGLAAKIRRDQDSGAAPTSVGATALAEMIADLRETRMRAIAQLRGAAYDAAVADLTEVVLRMVYGTV